MHIKLGELMVYTEFAHSRVNRHMVTQLKTTFPSVSCSWVRPCD